MIDTKIIHKLPPIIHHRVSGRMSENEAIVGTADVLSIVEQIIAMGERLNIILDMRGYVFENLKSHKIWATEFRQHRLVSENLCYAAVIGDSGPKLFAEKEAMETDELKFFIDFDSAYGWLQDQNHGLPKQV